MIVRLDLSLLRRPELGSVLLGRERESARIRAWRVRILLILSLLGSNLVGVAVAVVLSHESESESESESEPTPPRPPPVQVCVVSG